MTREEAGKKLSDWAKYMEDPSAVPELDQPCTDDEIIEAMSVAGKALSGTSTVNDGLDEAAEYFDDVIAMRMFDEEGKDISEIVRAAVKFGAEWQKERDAKEALESSGSCSQMSYELGRKDMRKEMLEGAVECFVEWYDGPYLNFTTEQMNDAIERAGAKAGDKVHVIVIKED